MADEVSELKKHVKEKKLIVGTKATMKRLRMGKLSAVFMSSNCPTSVKEDVAHYSTLAGTRVVQLAIPNEELGTVCKKFFSVSVAGVPRG